MKTGDQIAAEVEARRRAERDAKTAAAYEGEIMLETLWSELQPLQDPYDVYIDMSPRAWEQGIIIHRGGEQLAVWTPNGRALVFQASGIDKIATNVGDAIAITAEYLLRRN
jgi:hypothetical protein